MEQNKLIRQGYKEAQAITKKFAKTFYFSSFFLSPAKRRASFAVYAICRLTDDSVDNNLPAKFVEIEKIKQAISKTYSNALLDNPILLAFRETINKYSIPQEYFDELIQGMYMDMEINRYQNFKQLYTYCYRIAGVIGLIMLKIFENQNINAEKYAIDLGIAMQLTNISRDIKEDSIRGRIYIPLEEMERFQVTQSDLGICIINNNFKSLLKFQIQRAREYYCQTEKGIKFIKGILNRFTILAMKEIYSSILDAIEKNDYDVFSTRANVPLSKKLLIIIKIIFRGKYLDED